MFEPPLHLRTGQGVVAKWAHGGADCLCDEQGLQHAPDPIDRADLPFRPKPLTPGIDVLQDVRDERKVGPRGMRDGADKADSRVPSCNTSCSVQLAVFPTILSRGKPT